MLLAAIGVALGGLCAPSLAAHPPGDVLVAAQDAAPAPVDAARLDDTLLPRLGPPPRPPAVTALLNRYVDSTGGAEALAQAGDLELLGRIETIAFGGELRTLIRRKPFAVREEHRSPAGGPVRVLVTDLRHFWLFHESAVGEPGARGPHGHPLPADEAAPFALRAWTWRLLLDPLETAAGAQAGPTVILPEAPFFNEDMGEGRQVRTVVIPGPLGLTPNAWFDARDGRWLGAQWGPAEGGMQRIRAGRWQRHGELLLPAQMLQFDERGLRSQRTLTQVLAGRTHSAALFGGHPQPGPPGPVEAPLLRSPNNVPGSAHLLVGDVFVNRRGPLWGTLDTGANRLVLHPELAAALALPMLGPSLFEALGGPAQAPIHWVDELAVRGERRLQLVATVLEPPPHAAEPRSRQPSLVLGSDELADVAPVLDFEHDLLLLRGSDGPTLSQMVTAEGGAAPPVAEAELPRLDPASTSWAVELRVGDGRVRALFDTGFGFALRLSAAGLEALGLPTAREEWLARGGVPFELVGVQGPVLPDLLVRLDEFVLPAVDARDGTPLDVVWKQPWVHVSTAGSADRERSAFPAILGTGALLSFARVGLDDRRQRLELLPGARMTVEERPGGGRRLVVPPPGPYLGLLLHPPGGSHSLPHIARVEQGLPAERAGLRAGDALERVDDLDASTLTLLEIWERLWLPEGASVRLVVRREGRQVSVELP